MKPPVSSSVPSSVRPPAHVVPRAALAAGHGVARYAAEVAASVGAEILDPAEIAGRPAGLRLHVHVSDRLFGATAEAAADRLTELAARHRVSVTLHDLPQPSDGRSFDGRRRAYARIVEAAGEVAVNSHHEAHLARALGPGPVPLTVIALPVFPRPVARPAPGTGGCGAPGSPRPAVVGVLGWIYPGKGHAEVIEAAARLDRQVVVRALGGASPGHLDLLAQLATSATALGVAFEATGYLDENELAAGVAAVDVPVVAHRHFSASGSLNSWVGAGRRPIASAGRYTRELARLRPGTLLLVEDDPLALADAVAGALERPDSTWLSPGLDLRPGPDDVARAYLDWWAR